MDGARRAPTSGCADDQQRLIARCFYGLRAGIDRDPSSADIDLAYSLLSGAYQVCTGNVMVEMPGPSERRLWVAGVFVDLLRYVRVEVWNSTL